MMATRAGARLLFSTLFLWTLAGGCRIGGPEGEADGGMDADAAGDGAGVCNGCHGGEGNAAPPQGVGGEEATSSRAVGAHQAHLSDADWHVRVPCEACHAVPATVEAAGHIGMGPAELTWGELAMERSVSPSFDGVRCSNVYCHGGGLLPGGSNTTPVWTTVDGTQASCGTCHGLPPDPPHPAVDPGSCESCHPQRFADPTAFHVNGEVEVVDVVCSGCHGSDANAAPPADTSGNTETTVAGVGAHQAHLATGSTWHPDIACVECHVVPSSIGAAGHADSELPAELTWGPTAVADGSTPSYDGTGCAGVYCHGATLSGGSVAAPAWTTVDGTQAECGACHGLPPTEGHPDADTCSFCHPSVVDATRAIVNPALHINGATDF